MNRLLIGILDLLNKLLALLLIVSGGISGYYGNLGFETRALYDGPGSHVVWTLLGLVAGLVLAALVSGVLATIITISREATAIHHFLDARRSTFPPADRPV